MRDAKPASNWMITLHRVVFCQAVMLHSVKNCDSDRNRRHQFTVRIN